MLLPLTLMRALRWRVPGVLFLAGVPLALWTGHGLAWMAPSRGDALLVDAAGIAWGVVAMGLGLGAVALGQLIGVSNGRTSIARAFLPFFTGGIAAVLLGLQGWLDGVGFVGACWFAWFAFAGTVTAIGGLRYDTSARHHAGRVLLGFLVVAGTFLLLVALDHVVLGLTAYQVEGLSNAAREAVELDALYLRSGVRKMSFVALVLSLLLGGSASQGSMMPASDMRGSMSALFALGGLAVFALFEAWFTLSG